MTLRARSHGKSWTPEADDQLRTSWLNTNKTIAQLADYLDRSHSSIAARLVKLALVPNRIEARILGNGKAQIPGMIPLLRVQTLVLTAVFK